MLPYHKYYVKHHKYTPSEARATSISHCSGFSDLTKKKFQLNYLKKLWYLMISFVILSSDHFHFKDNKMISCK